MKPLTTARAVLAAAALVLVAACGGGGGGGLSDTPQAAGAAAPTGGTGGAARTTLKMLETPGGPLSFVSYGVQKGFFAEEGIDLQVSPNPGGGTASIPNLLNNEYDVSGLDLVSTLISVGRGLPLKIVAAGSATGTEPDKDFAAILVKGDSPIQSSKDFGGITLGVNALRNINEIVVRTELEREGLDADSVKLVELPFPEILAAIGRGDVDAGLVIEPFVTTGLAQGLRVVDRPYVALKPGVQIGAMVMTESRIAQDPAVVDAFARAVKKTADSIKADPAAFRAALPALIQLNAPLNEKVNLIQWQGETDPASVQLIGDSMRKYGLLDKDLDYASLIVH